MLTVGMLREQIARMPEDMPVVVDDGICGYLTGVDTEVVDVATVDKARYLRIFLEGKHATCIARREGHTWVPIDEVS
jgi:hypothetical protein